MSKEMPITGINFNKMIPRVFIDNFMLIKMEIRLYNAHIIDVLNFPNSTSSQWHEFFIWNFLTYWIIAESIQRCAFGDNSIELKLSSQNIINHIDNEG